MNVAEFDNAFKEKCWTGFFSSGNTMRFRDPGKYHDSISDLLGDDFRVEAPPNH
jgi:hypothetical protein